MDRVAPAAAFHVMDLQSMTCKATSASAMPARLRRGGTPPRSKWEPRFLSALAECSNVAVSAEAANITAGYVYKLRRTDPAFARKWRQALFEGYEHLEMETLCYLRGDSPPERKFDVGNALRVLAAHSKAIAAERALRDDEDEQAVLDSIDRMLDEMRERSAANTALLAEDDDAPE